MDDGSDTGHDVSGIVSETTGTQKLQEAILYGARLEKIRF